MKEISSLFYTTILIASILNLAVFVSILPTLNAVTVIIIGAGFGVIAVKLFLHFLKKE